MNYFLVNTKLHTLHTIKDGTKTAARIEEKKLKAIKIGDSIYRIFETSAEAAEKKMMLDFHGSGE